MNKRTSLFLSVVMVAAAAGFASPRLVQSLDTDWRFHLGEAPRATEPDYDDHAWRRVDVPHDYVVEGSFTREDPFPAASIGRAPDWYWLHGFLPVQPAVYRKTLALPAELNGKRLWLEFDGVFSNSRYFLNGREIGHQYSGYTRSRFDITSAATTGADNILTVQVDPRYDGWWYEGGGIYRHVRLVAADPVHIAPDGVFVAPSVEDPGQGDQADAVVAVQTEVTNTGSASVSAQVESEVLDDAGRVVATASSIYELGISSSVQVAQRLPLAAARLWSVERPYLYRLRSTVRLDDRVVDQVVTPFGVRHVRWDAERGFFLNGRPLKLQGVNMHQDHAGVGVAMPDRLFTWRLERLKEVGCNAIRMSHNPVTPFLLDECDRLGFIVIAENRHLGDTFMDQTTKEVPAIAHRDLSALVLRDRNHPSIVLWSLCNEQWISGTPEAAAMARAMKARVRELDPTRPVTAALNVGFDTPAGLIGELDVIGINYNPHTYDPVHRQFPHAPMIASEIASEITTRGIYTTEPWENYRGDREKGYVSAYSISAGPSGQVVEDAWPRVAARDFLGGGFVWAAFDYKGEPRPFQWPVINCHYGFMDICGFPKDSYYYYKSWWTDEPVLHLFPHWNWPGREGEEINVWVHSNADEVELFLNEASLGKKRVEPLRHLEWNVRYAPGRLTARAVRRGRALETSRETTGAPAQLVLTPDRTTITADGADVAVFAVSTVDAQGRHVPTADALVKFEITGGRIIGVGNGDPASHEPDKSNQRRLFNGYAQVIIQSLRQPGEIRLTAQADGLAAAETTLAARSAN
jgi:beta-galactosidase